MSPEDAARCCTLGLLLELATSPKPGLVDRLSNPDDYAYFTASAVALYPCFLKAARGTPVGDAVICSTREMMSWQRGGNTHLGSLLLLTPLAKAAVEAGKIEGLHRSLEKTLKQMDYRDLHKILKAIRIVGPGGLGKVAYLDVNSARTYNLVKHRKLSVVEAFKPYARWEVVAHEYCTNYQASMMHGYRFLRKRIFQEDWNTAGINTFLNILQHLPDSHVSRRQGRHAAKILSRLAKQVLDAGGVGTAEGSRRYTQLIKIVKRAGMKPAATADLLAVAYTLLLLSGWRP
ncbi:MAG: triphosphoribosyl-dephospho-CoA synthase [Candidatus Caldarchaeum sp.]|uniref:Triphosphoribosyl-dephospho-CoA synthase n=2 Tax=Caldiarchaeum subterraneum TaxID=311458 RepID=A0A7C4E1T5_CALS0|nr:triphosphoribosyl-dephospho-CoA synthase [Candidatus Caldarchaeales archaeon]